MKLACNAFTQSTSWEVKLVIVLPLCHHWGQRSFTLAYQILNICIRTGSQTGSEVSEETPLYSGVHTTSSGCMPMQLYSGFPVHTVLHESMHYNSVMLMQLVQRSAICTTTAVLHRDSTKVVVEEKQFQQKLCAIM